jgi:hypothetical protein
VQRDEVLPEHGGEGSVQGIEDRRASAEVLAQLVHATPPIEGIAPLAEHLDVRVPEAVDRLELVPDGEQVVVFQRLQEAQLQPVGVLELVHQNPLEALAVLPADPVIALQQVAGLQLQVREVQAGPAPLELGVPRAIALEQAG